MFIVAPRFFDGSRGFHRPGTFGHSDLDRGNEEKHIHVWLLRTSRLVGQVVAFLAAAGNARTAARSRRNDPGNGPHSRAGVHSSTAPAFVRSMRQLRHRARLDHRVSLHRPRGRSFCHRRAARRVVRRVRTRARRLSGAGSFVGPYNTRLHQTAPHAFLIQPVVNRCSVWATPPLISSRTLRYARRCSPRAEWTRGAAGEPEPLSGRRKSWVCFRIGLVAASRFSS